MGQWVILIVVALVAAALAWGVAALLMGRDPGLEPAEPDGRAIPLPTARPLTEADLTDVRFDITARGYRMAQVDQALRRVAYDIGYKEELIGVLEAEIAALREGRTADADALQEAREAAQRPRPVPEAVLGDSPADAGDEAAPAAPGDRADDAEQPDAEQVGAEQVDGKPAGDDPAADEWVATGAGTSGTSEGQPGGGAK